MSLFALFKMIFKLKFINVGGLWAVKKHWWLRYDKGSQKILVYYYSATSVTGATPRHWTNPLHSVEPRISLNFKLKCCIRFSFCCPLVSLVKVVALWATKTPLRSISLEDMIIRTYLVGIYFFILVLSRSDVVDVTKSGYW